MQIHTKDAYILFKDHKQNFTKSKQSRLINPTETELGLISQNIIKKITNNLLNTTSTNFWKDSSDNIKWVTNMRNKDKVTFIKFDIIDFYSSVIRDLLVNSINFAKNYIEMKLI